MHALRFTEQQAKTSRVISACPDDDLLIRVAHGRVPEDELAPIETHLDGCSACRTLVAAVAAGSAGGDPRAPGPVLRVGERMGRYEVERLVGSGGMGVLYAARDTALGRRVAVKVMRSDFADESGRARLLREAQAMAQLSHPNVVSVFDLGEVEERVFVAMEFVEGGTLRDWLATPRSVEEKLAVFVQAGEGLSAAHRAGIVHRDFKPANVLLGADGRVRVTDFGLARSGEAPREWALATGPLDLTQTGAILGTPAYMSPEQLRQQPADTRSDQYAFCVALHEALTGSRPFNGRTLVELRAEVLAGVPSRPPPTGVPEQVWRAVERGLAVDPARRFPSVDALLAELRSSAHGTKRPMVLLAGGLALVIALVALATVALRVPSAPPETAQRLAETTKVLKEVAALEPARNRVRNKLEALEKERDERARQEELFEPAVPETLPADGVELALEPDRTRSFDVTGSSRVVIVDPKVADVVLEETTLTLGGKSLGRTSLSVTAAGRTRTWPVVVRVAVPQPAQTLAMFVGSQRVLELPGVTRIAVGDPSTVDVKLSGHNQLLFTAKVLGTTNVLVWTHDARRLEYLVSVTNDAGPPPEPVLELAVGLQHALSVPGLKRFELGDDGDVCEAKVLGGHELLLTPRKPGRTTLIVWTADGRHQARVLVVRSKP